MSEPGTWSEFAWGKQGINAPRASAEIAQSRIRISVLESFVTLPPTPCLNGVGLSASGAGPTGEL
jgi:hypothetical protein